ncbi:MAG: hypothetical protein Q9162_003181 [Coniocarpon cinnabarinum]
MDGLSAAASVAGIAATAATLSKALFGLCQDAKEAQKDISDIAHDVHLLSTVLEELGEVFHRDQAYGKPIYRPSLVLNANKIIVTPKPGFETVQPDFPNLASRLSRRDYRALADLVLLNRNYLEKLEQCERQAEVRNQRRHPDMQSGIENDSALEEMPSTIPATYPKRSTELAYAGERGARKDGPSNFDTSSPPFTHDTLLGPADRKGLQDSTPKLHESQKGLPRSREGTLTDGIFTYRPKTSLLVRGTIPYDMTENQTRAENTDPLNAAEVILEALMEDYTITPAPRVHLSSVDIESMGNPGAKYSFTYNGNRRHDLYEGASKTASSQPVPSLPHQRHESPRISIAANLQQAFAQDGRYASEVAAHHFNLLDEEDNIILPDAWDAFVQPGLSIRMRLWSYSKTQPNDDFPLPEADESVNGGIERDHSQRGDSGSHNLRTEDDRGFKNARYSFHRDHETISESNSDASLEANPDSGQILDVLSCIAERMSAPYLELNKLREQFKELEMEQKIERERDLAKKEAFATMEADSSNYISTPSESLPLHTITVRDFLGRSFEVPLECCKSWESANYMPASNDEPESERSSKSTLRSLSVEPRWTPNSEHPLATKGKVLHSVYPLHPSQANG